MKLNNNRVFVTVGTTQFDDLVKEVTKHSALSVLYSKGFRTLSIQIGKGQYTPKEGNICGMNIEVFRYKPSLVDDYANADLVISHAGAGSCIEALEASKPLITVINNDLMDNHQKELAEALSEEGFCASCDTSTLFETLQTFEREKFRKYTPGNLEAVINYIDSLFILKD